MRFIQKEHYLNCDNDSEIDSMLSKEIQEYSEYFEASVEPFISKSFCKKYLEPYGLHDWWVISINQKRSVSHFDKDSLVVTLSNELRSKKGIKKTIVYEGVTAFKSEILPDFFTTFDVYGIDELIRINSKKFSHEVLFPSGSYYYVEFEKIKIELE